MAEAIHSFSELATEVKKAIDQEDVAVLENIEDNVELTSTAVRAHALNTYLIYNKKRYKVIQSISIGDTLTVGTNIQLAPDLTMELGGTNSEIQTLANVRAKLGAHNLLELPYYDGWEKTQAGVTFKVNADGSVTVSTGSGGATGEASFYLRYFQLYGELQGIKVFEKNPYVGKRVTMSGCPSGASTAKYYIRFSNVNSVTGNINLTTEERTFDVTDRTSDNVNVTLRIIIMAGQVLTTPITFYPMIRLADDTVSTYGAPSKSNVDLTADTRGLTENAFANGCVNLVQNTGTSKTVTTGGANLTFVVNSDGSVTVNGTTGTSAIDYRIASSPFEDGKSYKLSGCPSGGSTSTYMLYNGNANQITETGNGTTFTYSSSQGNYLYIGIRANQTITNLTFKPMLTVADMPNSDYAHYVPYAMTNKELTDIAEQEIGNYMYEGTHTASVSADGVKDYETLINDLSVTMLAKLQALADDEIVFVRQVSIAGNTSPTINKFISEFKNTMTSFDIDYAKTTITVGTGVNIIWGRLNTTKSGVRCASVSLNAGTAIPTPTDLRSTVPTSGTSFVVYYQVYKKIS